MIDAMAGTDTEVAFGTDVGFLGTAYVTLWTVATTDRKSISTLALSEEEAFRFVCEA